LIVLSWLFSVPLIWLMTACAALYWLDPLE